MSLAPDPTLRGFDRHFTTEGRHPFDQLQWARRDARIRNWVDGSVAFEQLGVEFPSSWSDNAVNIVSQKYFRGALGSDDRETSLRQVVSRVVETVTRWGTEGGYFVATEAEVFQAELTHLLVNQLASFNSPVWFNIGVTDVVPQASACFILGVEDTMASILTWYAEEGMIFKRGSGAGVNLSNLRGSAEGIEGGGTASGPVSFMRGADASAGTIKSGGTTRRAAKMVVLDADHPDIEEFIWCKAREERKAFALAAAGFDMGLDGRDSHSIQYQNANNSVRVTDQFMQAVVDDEEWQLVGRTTGDVVTTLRARDLFSQVAEAAWECADPGIQFDTTINRWHTAPNTGPITASNPCSEYFHLDNSACNLASINLLQFLGTPDGSPDETFDVEGLRAAVRLLITAQEILVERAHYPTDKIGETTRAFRQLGLGYSNLGALIMASGHAYDSDAGRALAASITALMTGEAYATSAMLAGRLGPFAGFDTNRDAMLAVLQMHQGAIDDIDAALAPPNVLDAACEAWGRACDSAAEVGVRNSQATVLAPTGTISFMMDCDTTGIEPDLGLVKTKTLVGGGTMSIINQAVPRALRRLGYTDPQVTDIVAHIDENHSVAGAPHLTDDHVEVFACSMGDNVIHYLGHIKMIAAVQPFLSGGVSKTVNVPESITAADISELYLEAWRLGVKAVAIYRDGSKLGQPLSVGKGASESGGADAAVADVVDAHAEPVRKRLPRDRHSRTFEFRVADCKGFVTVGEYDDGRPGEIFVRVSKQGSTLAGIMDAFAISISHGLQYGVPLAAFVDAFVGMRFEPQGMTDDPDLRISSSLMDYLFRKLAVMYLDADERVALNIFTTDERLQPTLPGVEEAVTESVAGADLVPDPKSSNRHSQLSLSGDAPFCMQCGTRMVRAGSCHVCINCGTTSGCS